MFSYFSFAILVVAFSVTNAEIKPKTETQLGGFTPMDLSNLNTLNRVKTLATFAMKSLNGKSNDLYHHNHIRILDAKSQVVAGSKYVITMYTGQTTCAKNQVQADQVTHERCPISNDANAKFNKCEVTIWEKTWENFIQMLNDKCETVTRAVAMS